MRKRDWLALLLLLLLIPGFLLAFVPFARDVRRNAVIQQGGDIVGRLRWLVEEYGHLPANLEEAGISPEDRGADVRYVVEDSLHYRLIIAVGKNDSVVYVARQGTWQ
jgi:hypothetical protein